MSKFELGDKVITTNGFVGVIDAYYYDSGIVRIEDYRGISFKDNEDNTGSITYELVSNVFEYNKTTATLFEKKLKK